jgi:mannose-1-phosphate guanylyltransferase/mannose-6-phosphate isomerase
MPDEAPPDTRPVACIDGGAWGHAAQVAKNVLVSVKVVKVHDGGVHSLQVHRRRAELWVIVDHGLRVEVDGVVTHPSPGDEVWIPAGSTHRVAAPNGGGRFIEVSFGRFDEADVTRLEDHYGRADPPVAPSPPASQLERQPA